MSEDASTAYICICCPFNSDNLEALESHLKNAHGNGCQDASSTLPQSSLSPSSSPLSTESLQATSSFNKASKREAPDDEQSQSSTDDLKSPSDETFTTKRIKRSSSNGIYLTDKLDEKNEHSIYNDDNESSDEVDDDDDDNDEIDYDERDSPAAPSRLLFTCPLCSSSYPRIDDLCQHVQLKHQINMTNQDRLETCPTYRADVQETKSINNDTRKTSNDEESPSDLNRGDSCDLTVKGQSNQHNISNFSTFDNNTTATNCPYCDFKTADLEQFKLHLAAHIRDKNYRCLLCNRLYKYRGDCSFHIRRKHHRYSSNSNDYIQRFVFDSSDGNETVVSQSGGLGSSSSGPINIANLTKDQEEPARYFGCPYCDYTSNYGGDVRKHQARKHPTLESKVVKIVRHELEQQNSSTSSILLGKDYKLIKHEDSPEIQQSNHENQAKMNNVDTGKQRPKIKTVKKIEGAIIQQYTPVLSIPPNFAPVRVFQCSSCHQQGTYKWVVERHIRAKHPDQAEAHVIELPAELAVKLQKLTPPLKRFRCSLCPLQSKHTWVIIRHIKHFHTLQTASVLDLQPDGKPIHDDALEFSNENGLNQTSNRDSDSSSEMSSSDEMQFDEGNNSPDHRRAASLDGDESDHTNPPVNADIEGSMILLYKCSLCNFTSNMSCTTQKHLTEFHPAEAKGHMITQFRSNFPDETRKSMHGAVKKNNGFHPSGVTITKVPFSAPLSPTSAMAKAKFSPAVEEALLSLQNSKLKNVGIYASQPKFGIKRLKCRHCFYRSNWKTDMIRHVRIRHNLTEPDHNKDMIIMSEEEARSTIDAYENTFGKELRRRTFRTWNDWAKAEEEFTPKDGSLQYAKSSSASTTNISIHNKSKGNISNAISSSSSILHEDIRYPTVIKVSNESPKPFSTTNCWMKDEFKPLPNPSNIVSRLLLTTSPSNINEDDTPLDLSIKPSVNKNSSTLQETVKQENENLMLTDEEANANEHALSSSSNIIYLCSTCPYKSRKLSSIEKHLRIHFSGCGLVCPLCSFVTSSSEKMKRHMATIHPTSQDVHRFSQATSIPNAQIIERYRCPQCSYQCETAEDIEVHCRFSHSMDRHDASDIRSLSNDDSVDSEDESIHSSDEQILHCPLCKNFSVVNSPENLKSFAMHLFTNHDKQIRNNQSCPFCSFIAHSTSVYTLSEHIELHFNGKLLQPDLRLGFEHLKELINE